MDASVRQPPGRGPFLVPADVPPGLIEAAKEFSRQEERARFAAQAQFERAKGWRTVNLSLGSITAAVSALAGVLTFASDDLDVLAGLSALLGATLVAVLTTVAPERKATRAEQAANAYLALQTRARRALLVEMLDLDPQGVHAELRKLATEMDEVNRSADPPGRRARKRAHQNIIQGGQVYGVDEQ